MDVLHIALNAVPRVHVAQRRVLPAGHPHRQVLLRSGKHPGIPRIDLVMLLQPSTAKDPVHEFVREAAFPGAVGLDPFRQHRGLDPAHRLHLGNARVGHAVHMPVQQGLLFRRRQVPIVRDPLVVIVRDQVENVLLQVGPGADDGVHLVLADHLRERDAQLGSRHRSRHRHQHLAPLLQMSLVTLGRVHQGRCVEMAVILGDETGHRPLGLGQAGVDVLGAHAASSYFHVNNIEPRPSCGHKKHPRSLSGLVRLSVVARASCPWVGKSHRTWARCPRHSSGNRQSGDAPITCIFDAENGPLVQTDVWRRDALVAFLGYLRGEGAASPCYCPD